MATYDSLQLPVDVHRTPGTVRRPARFAFDLPAVRVEAANVTATLAAAFGILLFRYNGQSTIPLSIAGSEVRFLTSMDTLCRAVLDEAAHAVAVQSVRISANDDLILVATAGETLAVAFEYDASLFRATTVERLAGHLCTLFEHLPAFVDRPLSEVPLLPSSERAWLDSICIGPASELAPAPLLTAVTRHAAATPDAVAVRFRDRALTYPELERRSNQLARHLLAMGIRAESRVVVCLEPSLDIAIALLGILKAGGVYVPLDPTYPPGRIAAIFEDTTPVYALTRSHLVDKLPGLERERMLTFDEADVTLDSLSGEDPAVAIDPQQTAYVYFTSGTTGKPKGVMASHANLVNYIEVAQRRYAFSSRDVMPAIARFSFSISMFELLSPLVAGGTLVVLERDHILDLERMAKTLSQVTFFHMGPSLLRNVVAYIERHCEGHVFSGVRHASSGGDTIPPDVIEGLKRIFPEAEVFVIYGASEISCMGCTYPVPRTEPMTKTFVGRPFANTEVRLLDGALGLVPAGVVGEICFAGGGVVKGYLARPELTAAKFVEILGKRFYRTGDMGRLSEDGWLEILGRSDFQVKLRGMRVELGEVEYNLRSAPGVRDGVVTAKAGPNGEKTLVAYVVTERNDASGRPRDRGARLAPIRLHMSENLPDYMVPSAYVELPSLPLNHNMKVDRHALPDPSPDDLRGADAPPLRPPDTATEKALAALWKRLLRVDDVGKDDNFFELGGYSMLAIELILEAERELGFVFDGMDVLRECLEVLGRLVDRGLGQASRPNEPAVDDRVEEDRVDTFFFGPESALYGVLHRGDPSAADAVLVCMPVGAEHLRTHFVLQRFARTLAARGVHVMLFDYFACGDSLGESVDATPSRWERDITEAHAELRRRSGAQRIVGVGVRLGGTLLSKVASRLGLSRLVLWDPVVSGREYHSDLAELHRRYLLSVQHLRFRWPTRRAGGESEELAGMRYSQSALRELDALSLAPSGGVPLPVKWLATSRAERQKAAFARAVRDAAATGSRFQALDFDSLWQDIASMEDVLPDVGIARALATLVQEEP